MNNKKYYIILTFFILLLVLIPSLIFQLDLTAIMSIKNLEAIGLKQYVFFFLRNLSLFFFILAISHLIYQVYLALSMTYFPFKKYLLLDFLMILILFAITFSFFPGIISVNGMFLLLDVSAHQFEQLDSKEIENSVIHLMKGNTNDLPVNPVPSLNDHTVVYGQTEDKRKYLCANLYKILDQSLESGFAKTGAEKTLKFFKVPEVSCIGLNPSETPKPK